MRRKTQASRMWPRNSLEYYLPLLRVTEPGAISLSLSYGLISPSPSGGAGKVPDTRLEPAVATVLGARIRPSASRPSIRPPVWRWLS